MTAAIRLRATLFGLAFVVAACSRTQAPRVPTQSETLPPSSVETPSPVPTGGGSSAATLARLCRRPDPLPSESVEPKGSIPSAIVQVQRQIEQIRGLEFIDPVAADPVTQPELVKRLSGSFDRSYPQELYARKSLAWQTIGVIPQGTSIRKAVLNFASGQVIGFYVPTTGELVFIGSEDPTPLERITLAHEFTHAIDDQHFHLERLDDLESDCRDEALSAGIAAVEGSAQFFSFQFARQFLSLEEQLSLAGASSSAEGVPPFILRMQLWPYTEGLEFISALDEDGGTEAVNGAIDHLPLSTEQVIHPERYPTDAPQPVDVPNLARGLGEGWRDLDVQEVGEEWLAIMLGLRLEAGEADAAAAGWDGGLYRAWSDGYRVAVVLATVWDTKADAEEFANTIDRWFQAEDQIGAVSLAGTQRVDVGFASDAETLAAIGLTG